MVIGAWDLRLWLKFSDSGGGGGVVAIGAWIVVRIRFLFSGKKEFEMRKFV